MAPDRRLIFDINDFDETHPGPFEWDVKRLAASVAVAGRTLGLKRGQRDAATTAAAASYREEIRRLAALRHLEVWYSRVDLGVLERYLAQISARRTKRLKTNVAKAERKDSLRALAKLTVSDGDHLRIVSEPPLIVPIEELPAVKDAKLESEQVESMLRDLIDRYRSTLGRDVHELARRYDYVHAAHKVVGVGSVGAQAWIVLTLGRDRGDPLFLQVKEAQRSVLEPYTRPSRFKNQGRRVVEGQRLMQAASDVFLGWLSAQGLDGRHRDYYVRQLWDGKGSAAIETMDAEGLRLYAALCGGTLARAHARSGDRIAIAAYLGKGDTFERAIGEFAEAYADQNERDYGAFSGAVASGHLEAQRDV
jgi:hypothetical protein